MGKIRNLISLIVLIFFSLLAGGSLITGELSELWFWGIGAVIILIIFLVVDSNKQKERKEKLNKANTPTENFKASVKIESSDATYSFSIDNERRKIMIVTADNKRDEARKRFIDFADIISVELLEDSNITFSKSTIRTIGGSIVGGAIAGGTGTIIGGLSGDSKVEKRVSSVEIKILLRDQKSPSCVIKCYDGEGSSMKTDNLIYKENIIQPAKKIVDHISVIIDMMDREYQHQEMKSISKTETESIAEELEKLCALKEKGIISQEEFEKLKEKLLQ